MRAGAEATAPPVPTVRVHANAHVLGMFVGEEASLPLDTIDLAACVQRGLVTVMDGTEVAPLTPTASPCGCGGSGG